MKLFVSTAKGIEDGLVRELNESPGISPNGPGEGAHAPRAIEKTRAGVALEGTLETAYRICLWSRLANRVLLPLKSFPAPTPEKLYGGVKSIRWSEHLGPRQTLAVDFTVSEPSEDGIQHTHFGALKTKDAIVDQIRSVKGERPSVDPVNPDVRVNVYVRKDVATVSIDLSGESLHKRGYREPGAPAPMKENLAAALLAAMDWEKHARRGASFYDPMCGSGTLPIEAAMVAARMAPGILRRKFGFEGWLGHDPALWKTLRAEARTLMLPPPKTSADVRIFASDVDGRAVSLAQGNARAADLSGWIKFAKMPLDQVQRPVDRLTGEGEVQGVFLANPPYGERLGEVEELMPTYKALGDLMKQRFQNWEGGIFTGSPELSKVIGLRASRRHVFFNGPIECRLFTYSLYSGKRE